LSDIHIRRQHNLGLAKCKSLGLDLVTQLQSKLGGQYSEEENCFFYSNKGAKGQLTAADDYVEISIKLSLLTKGLKSKIQKELEQFCDEHLA